MRDGLLSQSYIFALRRFASRLSGDGARLAPKATQQEMGRCIRVYPS
jgi:hypothetical protein